jgi:hypothetical protein
LVTRQKRRAASGCGWRSHAQRLPTFKGKEKDRKLV